MTSRSCSGAARSRTGRPSRQFEEAFAAYCGVDHCVGVGSGLDALRLGLTATGIEPGAEVVVPAATFVATLEAVTQAGGVPVVVDVSEDDYCLDPAGVAAAVGPRTHALMPVHLYGQLADMRELRRVADGAGVAIIEDACQAHGATRDGRARRRGGRRCGLQLLSRQEPRRRRGRRSARDP